jgi:putative methyltransferase (TIGR04325 family)
MPIDSTLEVVRHRAPPGPRPATRRREHVRNRLHEILDRALEAPLIARARMKRFDAEFAAGHYAGNCRGVFDTYAKSAAAAPRSLPLGYDNEKSAAMYRARLDRLYPGDYPMVLWLGKAFAAGARRVFDLGGHVGVGYYAYRRYLDYPAELRWQIHDVPAVIASGRELAEERDSWHQLEFSESFDEAANADVLFTSGCLQYLEQTLAERVSTLKRRPEWLLVNLLPLHATLDYWTVQSIGSAFCPYHIQKRAHFFDALQKLGYQSLDVWENAEKRCEVAFAHDHDLDRYYGAALRLT